MKRAILIIMAALCTLSLLSCYSKSGRRQAVRPEQIQESIKDFTVRAKVLENNTMTYIIINMPQYNTLKALDTVWADLDTHTICDTGRYTMKVVLYNK